MAHPVIQSRRYKTFTQVSPPLTLTRPGGEMFFPWKGHATRDAASSATHASIGAVAKQAVALDPARLTKVLAVMRDVGDRIARLEAKRAAPQPAPTHDAPSKPLAGTLVTGATLGGGAVLIGEDGREVFINPTHHRSNGAPDSYAFTPTRDGPPRLFSKKTKDAVMPTPRNPGLAPNRFITTHAAQRGFNDAAYSTQFGERPSRFTSQEADRLARHAPGASLPSPAELNAVNQRAHAGVGASGQAHDTTQPGASGGQPGILRRGGMLEAKSNDLSEAFANELDKIPSGQPQTALNAYHAAFHKARTGEARDAIDKIWSAFRRR